MAPLSNSRLQKNIKKRIRANRSTNNEDIDEIAKLPMSETSTFI